ncbi:MAG TPA: FAD-binding oxidoreductase [Actinomycetota bacterium]|nr:FAD-binding oxidoreductase [Actinomycetota bacterium]
MSLVPDTTLVQEFRRRLTGRVIAPDDDGYDEARTIFYGGYDRRPAVIARVADAADVSTVIRLAREGGLELAVRSGGHSVAGHSASDGIVLDLSGMKAIDVDVENRNAWAETGFTAAEFASAAAPHGLGVGLGDTGSVGIGGITVGGGIGYLVRKHGLTIDDLLAAEIVTADGELLHADEDAHPDLFWAIRGGGGNFGVATRFRFRLHELDTVVGGMLMLPATAETIEGFVALADAAPRELSTIANVMPAPPLPFVPEERRGQLVLLGLMCYAGDAEDGAKALAPFRALAEPVVDMLRTMPYPEVYPPEEAGFHPTGVLRTSFVDAIDHASADTILERLEASTAQMSVTQFRVLGGAMAEVPSDATAFAHRDRRLMVNVAALYGDPAERATHEAWVDGFAREIQRGPAGAYVNFLGDEGEARVRQAYPGATWERLAEIKGRYDPTNLFRLNQNVPHVG